MKIIPQQYQRQVALVAMLFMLGANLMAGCTHESSSYHKSVQNSDGQTTAVVEETKTTEHHDHTGVLGGAFHLVGEILAFPFEVIAGVFRFIF